MMDVFQFCNGFAVNAFDIYIIIRFLKVILKGRLYDKRFLYTAIAINMIVRLLEGEYVPYVWVNFITSVFLTFMLVGCYKSQMWKKFAVATGVILLSALSEMIIALLIGIDNLDFLAKGSNGENIALFLSRIIFWVIVSIVLKILDRANPDQICGKVAVLKIIVFLMLIIELTFFCVRKQENIVIESVVLVTSEVTVYLMIYLQDCLVELFASRKQASLIEQEKEYYQREAVIILQKQELQRQFRHDLKNRLQILNEIAEFGNIAELKKYLLEIGTKYREQEVFSNTGNLIIDSIINSKLQDAVEKGIKVNASVMLPSAIEVKTDDMVVILGNLLDNAIEACERIEFSKYIKLFVNYEKGCIVLSIQNSFDQVVSKDGELITRKKDKSMHGLGIKSVKNTVRKYNGVIEFTSKGREFSVNIILYL